VVEIQLSRLHGQEVVSQRFGQRSLVGGEHDGAACGAKAAEQGYHLARAGSIHVGEGLVQQQQFRLGQQHPGQGSTLPHALRVLADRAGKRGIEAHRSSASAGVRQEQER
jgi:hypothetical protein